MASRPVGRRRADRRSPRRERLDVPAGHGHGHGHGDHVVDTSVVDADAIVARRVRIVVAAILAPLITAAVITMIVLWPGGGVKVASYQTETARGEVTKLVACPEKRDQCDLATVQLSDGPDKGKAAPVQVPQAGKAPIPVKVGDTLMLGVQSDATDIADRYQYVDHDRTKPLLILAAVFALAVVALSRWRGLAALGALAVTAVMLTQFILPAILKGSNPLLVAVVGGTVIMAVALFLTHGISAESSIALSGTVAALGLTVLLGWFFTKLTLLTGIAPEGASAAKQFFPNLDLTGLLVAGMVIGALGVLDDVTVTQAAAVWELSAANPAASRAQLIGAGLRIGRTHVASVVNTLVLAYAGAAMPVLITFAIQGLPGQYVVSTELVAMEIVRGLVGSLGIIAAVPLTTALAAMAVADRSRDLAGTENNN
ncbi:YibE/F family protein [Kribbella sandramycini]|uniref:Putative membrane protein n=1 Tax=Kribbella sandramycini TaxID=60450 RepID=A0A7Y4KX23_9ACTN|nr:YibE/F family protein [Kribbella sandramycini]MBB6568120.1 putative membrane protein [Kribbella sandramycini]NOL39286.1 YibE/F family protein [Kribbella sandramycini]